MKKILYSILGLSVLFAGTVYALPYFSEHQTMLPFVDSAYDLGTSTKAWRNLYTDEICLAGDCQTAWPTGGGGSGGGTWSTTTTPVSGVLFNYPNNNDDVILIGSNSSTTAEVYFDPNTQRYQIGNAATASTTLLGTLRIPNLSQGFSFFGSGGLLSSIASSSIQLSWFNNDAGFLKNVLEDTTPELGGDLDANSRNITELGDITFKTGAAGGTIRTGTFAADKFELQAYDVNGGFYQKVLEADAGNTPTLEVFADSFAIWDNADETKKVNFTLSGESTGVTTNLAFSATANRTITFPNQSGTIALTSDITGGTSAYEIATTSTIGVSQLSYFTNASGRTTLGGVATTTLTASSPLSLSQAVVKVGGSNSVLSLDTSGAWTGSAGSVANALTAGTGLSSAGTFNGATARTFSLDMASANSWTALQTFANSSTTLGSFDYSSSTDARIGTLTFGGVTGSVWSTFCNSITGGAGLCDGVDDTSAGGNSLATTSPWTFGNLSVAATNGTVTTIATSTLVNNIFPFTSYGISTSSVFGFSGGLFSTASSTFSDALRLTSLSQGSLYVGSTGLVNTVATSTPTVTAPITYSGTLGSFIGGSTGTFGCTNASSGVTGCLTGTDWDTFNGKLSSYDAWTHPAVGYSATTSALTISSTATSTFAGRLSVGTTTTDTLASATFTVKGLMSAVMQIFTSAGTKIMDITDSVVTLLGTWDYTSAILKLPFSADPTINANGSVAINSTTASSSIRYYDGTAERAIYDTFDKPTIYASSTLVYDGAYGASGTTTYSSVWNPSRPTTLVAIYCKTDVGTAWYEVGTGSATSTVQCTTSGAVSTTNVSFTLRQSVMEAIGRQASNPNRITVTPTFRQVD